jgi:hypothetical protein
MPPLDARRNQSERESVVVRRRCEVGRSAECMVLVVAPQKASATEITGMVRARKKQLPLEAHQITALTMDLVIIQI